LTFAVSGAPAHGVLSGQPPQLTYTPAANYFGSDGFTFVAKDTWRTSAVALVTINVTPWTTPHRAESILESSDGGFQRPSS